MGLDNVIYPRLQKMFIDFARSKAKKKELVHFLRKTTGNLNIPIGSEKNKATETEEVEVKNDGSSGDPMDPLNKYDLDNMNSEELLAAADQILADTKKVIADNTDDSHSHDLDAMDSQQKVDEESGQLKSK